MKIKRWQPLKRGDVVELVAPAWACKPEELRGAVDFLEQNGLVPRWNQDLFQERLLFSHEHEERFRQLKKALLAEDSAAVWCLRGGYGSLHLLPRLEKLKRPEHSKLFIGISDITSLHMFLNQNWGWPTLHAPLLDRLGVGKLTAKHEKELLDLCFGRKSEITYKSLKAINTEARANNVIQGEIVGGNLTTIQSSIGTPFQLNTKSKFIFIEDIGERGYRVDRIFEHMRQAGLFKGTLGLLVGDFVGGDERSGENLVFPVIKDWAERLGFPVVTGLPCGHADIQRPLPFGVKAVLRCGTRPSLEVPSGSTL